MNIGNRKIFNKLIKKLNISNLSQAKELVCFVTQFNGNINDNSIARLKFYIDNDISCWVDRMNKLIRIGHCKVTLETSILRMGEILGTEWWENRQRNTSLKASKKYHIETKGQEEADKIAFNKGKSFRDSNTQKANSMKFQEKRKTDPEKYSNIYPNQVGYWTKLGYTQEDAKNEVSKYQTTFSLSLCIERYGDQEGTFIFNNRQEKWQNTIQSKSIKELGKINAAKGSDKNGNPHKGIYCESYFSHNEDYKNIPAILYYVRFWNNDTEFWKIGISKYLTTEERFGENNIFLNKTTLHKKDVYIERNTLYNCYIQEQKILSKYKPKRVKVSVNGFSTTEAFLSNMITKQDMIIEAI